MSKFVGGCVVLFVLAVGYIFITQAQDLAALFGAFFAHEQHASGVLAIGPGNFLLINPTAGKVRAIGNGEPHGAVGLDDVDARCRDDAEIGILTDCFQPSKAA